jgi:hypothetical protein
LEIFDNFEYPLYEWEGKLVFCVMDQKKESTGKFQLVTSPIPFTILPSIDTLPGVRIHIAKEEQKQKRQKTSDKVNKWSKTAEQILRDNNAVLLDIHSKISIMEKALEELQREHQLFNCGDFRMYKKHPAEIINLECEDISNKNSSSVIKH